MTTDLNTLVLENLDSFYKSEDNKEKLESLIVNLGINGKFTKLFREENDYTKDEKWQKSEIGEICDLNSGGTPSRETPSYWDGDIPWLKSGELNDGLIEIQPEESITEKGLQESSAKFFEKGTLIIALYGATAGKLGILDFGTTTNQAVCAIFTPDELNDWFLFYCLRYFREELLRQRQGSGQPNLNQSMIKELKINLPPIEEQKKIVEKLDQLLGYCDKLESEYERKENLKVDLNKSLLTKLTNSTSENGLPRYVHMLEQNFDSLYDNEENIRILKQSILKMALKGQFDTTEAEDQPAADLLRKIQQNRSNLYENGEIRKPKETEELTSTEYLYELNKNWEWVRLGEVINADRYGYTASADESIEDVKFLRITDVQDNQVNWDEVPGCEIPDDEIEKYQLNEGDIVIARTGGTVGKSFLVENCDFKAVFASYLIRIEPNKYMNNRFLKLFLDSPQYWEQISDGAIGTGQANVNATKLRELVFPLAPAKEQERIVQKVDSLFKLCDQLKEKNKRRLQIQEELTDSMTHKLINSQ